MTRIGKEGFEALIETVVNRAIEKNHRERVEPRLMAFEGGLRGTRDRLTAVCTRLDVEDRLARLEADVAVLKAAR